MKFKAKTAHNPVGYEPFLTQKFVKKMIFRTILPCQPRPFFAVVSFSILSSLLSIIFFSSCIYKIRHNYHGVATIYAPPLSQKDCFLQNRLLPPRFRVGLQCRSNTLIFRPLLRILPIAPVFFSGQG